MNDSFYLLLIISVTGIAMIITGFILLQVRNQDKLLQKHKQMAATELAHQKTLLQAVITSQETERLRIGSDLHDEVGAVLSSLRMLIEKHAATDPSGTEQHFTSQSKTIIDHVIKNVREIAHNLSPNISGNVGFYDAVHELCHTVSSAGTIALSLDFTEQQIPAGMNDTTAMAVYRVLAELINNTIKHAKAHRIDISIVTAGDAMQISYADDGTGFKYDVSGSGMGLKNIESRLTMIQANWWVPAEIKKGFAMQVWVPISNPVPLAAHTN